MIKQVTFADVKIGQEFKACWNPNNPIYFDTYYCVKLSENEADSFGQFGVTTLNKQEPVFIKVE